MAKVIFDSDAIFALHNSSDPLSLRALKIYEKLIEQEAQLIYPSSVVFETISLFQRVLKSPQVLEIFLSLIQRNTGIVFYVDKDLFSEALQVFNPRGSIKNSIVDCSVMVCAKALKADAIFSFDEFYKKKGFKLAEELI